jgi:medium-chain acyl-[acyl-carrier-protein] hydrolase
MKDPSRWLTSPGLETGGRVRLFCLPYAGGGASIFRGWSAALGPDIDVRAIQLPGREERIAERPYRRMAPLVTALAHALAPALDMPYVVFGHSMGAAIGFELARELRRRGAPSPLRLFASGHRAPHLPSRDAQIHQLPEPQLVNELRRFNGTPEEVLRDRDMMRLILPTLRADFELCETYACASEPPLPSPITAFGGLHDDEVRDHELLAWRDHTAGMFRMQLFHGNHFFIQAHRTAVLRSLTGDLQWDLAACHQPAPGR